MKKQKEWGKKGRESPRSGSFPGTYKCLYLSWYLKGGMVVEVVNGRRSRFFLDGCSNVRRQARHVLD